MICIYICFEIDMCFQGYVKLNDTLMLGPDPLGQFQPMVIKSIHRKRMPVREVRGGQTASFALKKVQPKNIDCNERNIGD